MLTLDWCLNPSKSHFSPTEKRMKIVFSLPILESTGHIVYTEKAQHAPDSGGWEACGPLLYQSQTKGQQLVKTERFIYRQGQNPGKEKSVSAFPAGMLQHSTKDKHKSGNGHSVPVSQSCVTPLLARGSSSSTAR